MHPSADHIKLDYEGASLTTDCQPLRALHQHPRLLPELGKLYRKPQTQCLAESGLRDQVDQGTKAQQHDILDHILDEHEGAPSSRTVNQVLDVQNDVSNRWSFKTSSP